MQSSPRARRLGAITRIEHSLQIRDKTALASALDAVSSDELLLAGMLLIDLPVLELVGHTDELELAREPGEIPPAP